jgi:hypothetical protein
MESACDYGDGMQFIPYATHPINAKTAARLSS